MWHFCFGSFGCWIVHSGSWVAHLSFWVGPFVFGSPLSWLWNRDAVLVAESVILVSTYRSFWFLKLVMLVAEAGFLDCWSGRRSLFLSFISFASLVGLLGFSASRLVRWLLGFSACWLLGLPCGFSTSQVTMGFNSKVYWLMYTFTYDYLGYPHDLGKRPYWFFNFSVSKEFDPNTSDKRFSIYGRNQCLSAQGIRISRPARGAPRHRRGWLLHLICGHPSMDPWFIQMNMD